MAPKHTPFAVFIHFTGQKSKEEIQEIYSDFYIQNIKDALIGCNLSDNDKIAVIDRIIRLHSQQDGETRPPLVPDEDLY